MSAVMSCRAYTIEPELIPGGCGRWVLTLTDGGESAGGGVFPWVVDSTGFDAGYQDAIEAGESWVSE